MNTNWIDLGEVRRTMDPLTTAVARRWLTHPPRIPKLWATTNEDSTPKRAA